MSRVVHFELTADDVDRAVTFYREVFGWEVSTWGGPDAYWLANTGDGPGIDGAIMGRAHGQPTIVTVEVTEPIETVVARIRAHGGDQIGEIGLIPGVGRHAYARDCEHTVIGLLEPPVAS